MANIQSFLNKIKSAIYGEEVRGSIVSAIEAMNEESSSADRNTSTIVNKINASTASATGTEEGTSPTVRIDDQGTKFEFVFTIPKGDTGSQGETGAQGPQGEPGASGVYVGSDAPTDPDVNVWIDPDGEASFKAVRAVNGVAADDEGNIRLMAEDLGAASEEEVSRLKDDLDEQNNKITKIDKKQTKRSILDIKKNFYPYAYPSSFLGAYKPLDIFTDGTSYFVDFKESDFKHSGGTIYYTGKDGIWSNNGLTPDKPTSLRNAIVNLAQSGDTVYVSEGVYGTEFLMNIPYIISKGINIVGENDNVVFVYGNKGTFTYDEENQCYKARGSYVGRVIDFTRENEIEYKKLTSVSDVKSNGFSFYTDNSYVWVNSPNLSDLMLVKASETFRVANTEDAKLYVRGISFVGGNDAILVSKNKDYALECIFYKCKFNYGISRCGLNAKGGNYLLVECEANGNKADGFCYSGYNKDGESVEINFFEVNCIGANNGLNDDSYTHNGSTCHNGTKGIRVNGKYYNNNGGNVVDVHPDTQTINLGCMAFDSACPRTQSYCQGFGLQQESAEMWLENCVSFGNLYDYFTVPNTTIHADKCARESGNDTTTYHGTLDETNRREMYYFSNVIN